MYIGLMITNCRDSPTNLFVVIHISSFHSVQHRSMRSGGLLGGLSLLLFSREGCTVNSLHGILYASHYRAVINPEHPNRAASGVYCIYCIEWRHMSSKNPISEPASH